MTDPSDVLRVPTASERFDAAISARAQELAYLSAGLHEAMAVVEDIATVNAALEQSSRPDLVITEPAEMMAIQGPYDRGGNLNNFTPNLTGFGAATYVEEEVTWGIRNGQMQKKFTGRQQPSREELDLYLFLGARGSYHEHLAFAEENGIDADFARDLMMATHINKEAFVRMWILFPELTERIMATMLDTGEHTQASTVEEVYVAYSIMSCLVDANDTSVKRPELKGQVDENDIDPWYLCR